MLRTSEWDAPPQGWVFGKLGSLPGAGEFFPPYVESRTCGWGWARLFTGYGPPGPQRLGIEQESPSSEREMGKMRV